MGQLQSSSVPISHKFITLKLILKDEYISHENALRKLDLETLKERRNILCLNFARKCLKNPKNIDLFRLNERKHLMQPREHEHYKVFLARTNKFKESPVTFMQNILNTEVKRKIDLDNYGILDQLTHCY